MICSRTKTLRRPYFNLQFTIFFSDRLSFIAIYCWYAVNQFCYMFFLCNMKFCGYIHLKDIGIWPKLLSSSSSYFHVDFSVWCLDWMRKINKIQSLVKLYRVVYNIGSRAHHHNTTKYIDYINKFHAKSKYIIICTFRFHPLISVISLSLFPNNFKLFQAYVL